MAEVQSKTYMIRFARESDVPEILNMINELAIYEKELDSVQATHESLLSTLSFPIAGEDNSTSPTSTAAAAPGSGSGSGSNSVKIFTPGFARTILIFSSSSARPAGMALYFTNYSTWRSAPGIYLEDLFVRPEFRGRGLGKALLSALARECVAIGGKRLEWSVLKWNEPSIQFYQSRAVGAKRMEEWVGMRVEGDGLIELGEGGDV